MTAARVTAFVLATSLTIAAAGAPPETYRNATAPYAFHFPRDHASHPDYRTEWWYYTGQLESPGRAFGFELTFFRIGIDRARERSRSAWAPHSVIVVHAALTDETRRRFDFDEAVARPALGLAGADTARYRVWIDADSAGLALDGRTHALHARASRFALDLALRPVKPPAVHGQDGVSVKGAAPGEASHYYSMPRLEARGRVGVAGETLPVRGEAWMDHEFGSGALGPTQRGWDWFALRLDDGWDVMLYEMRLQGGGIDPSSSGSLISARGDVRHLARSEYDVEATAHWTSPHSRAVYPKGWRVRLPREGLDLEVEPTVADQELVSRAMGGVTYWEGSVRVRGTSRGRAVQGKGYVELTGYAGPPPGR